MVFAPSQLRHRGHARHRTQGDRDRVTTSAAGGDRPLVAGRPGDVRIGVLGEVQVKRDRLSVAAGEVRSRHAQRAVPRPGDPDDPRLSHGERQDSESTRRRARWRVRRTAHSLASFWYARGGEVRRRVAPKALAAMKERVREITTRSGGRSMDRVIAASVTSAPSATLKVTVWSPSSGSSQARADAAGARGEAFFGASRFRRRGPAARREPAAAAPSRPRGRGREEASVERGGGARFRGGADRAGPAPSRRRGSSCRRCRSH